MFNVRIKRYLETEQIQIFSTPLNGKGSEREDNRKFIYSTGEICPPNRKIIYSLFEDGPVIGHYMGNEEQNRARSFRRTKNNIYDIAKSNNWEWFITLTFNKEKVDRYNYSEVTSKLSKWLNNTRRLALDMKYIVVPEHHEDGAWHFHGLFSDMGNVSFIDSGLKDKQGRQVYNVGQYKLGWTTATKVTNVQRACSYVCGYITQDLCKLTEGKKKYWYSRNCNKPIVEDFLISYKNDELLRIEDIADWSKKVYSEYVDVTYLELPIYTTNTTRFLTNEAED